MKKSPISLLKGRKMGLLLFKAMGIYGAISFSLRAKVGTISKYQKGMPDFLGKIISTWPSSDWAMLRSGK